MSTSAWYILSTTTWTHCPRRRRTPASTMGVRNGKLSGFRRPSRWPQRSGWPASRCGRSRSFAREENAMKFMFMIYHDENVLDVMPEKEMQALVDSAIEYAEEIRRSGHYIVSDALQRTQTARTIRVRAGKVSTTDGPFAETKEQLGGFFLIEAKDMDEACAIAARFPPARVAVIEVRPVQELKHSRDRRGLPS